MTEQELLLACATEFRVLWRGKTIYISRYSNHGRLLEDERWCVGFWPDGGPGRGGITNVLYLGKDQVWRYKVGGTWDTAQEAINFLYEWACPPGSKGWNQIADDKMAAA